MKRSLLALPVALPLTLVGAATTGLAVAGPASAGGGVSCSFTSTTAARVSAVTLPAPVKAGSTVSGSVTISRVAGSTGALEVQLAPSSWTRTNACVVVPAGRSTARFDVTVSPVRTSGNEATVGAWMSADGSDAHSASSPIVAR